MKHILIIIGMAIISACNYKKDACLDDAKALFPNKEIYSSPSSKYRLYAVDSAGIITITCLNIFNDDIDNIQKAVKVN